MRNKYWTCSKFADWLRGTMKPESETIEGWDSWRIEAEKKHPYRFWLAEEGLDAIQNVVMFIPNKLYDIKYNLLNRFVTRTHTLTSNLKRGQWHELDERILHSLFDELVNFVEVELAASNFRWDEETRKKYRVPFWGIGWFRTRTYRNVEAARVACIPVGKVFYYVGVRLQEVSLPRMHPGGAWRNTVSSHGMISSGHGQGCVCVCV